MSHVSQDHKDEEVGRVLLVVFGVAVIGVIALAAAVIYHVFFR